MRAKMCLAPVFTIMAKTFIDCTRCLWPLKGLFFSHLSPFGKISTKHCTPWVYLLVAVESLWKFSILCQKSVLRCLGLCGMDS